MIGERRPFWRKVAPPLPQTCQCGSRPPPHLSRLFTGGEAARRSVSRTAVNNERSLSSSFVQSGACVHRNNRRHPVRESRRAAFFRFPVSSFSFEMYTVEELCIRECCGQGFDKHESLWKGRDGVCGREEKLFFRKVFPPFPNILAHSKSIEAIFRPWRWGRRVACLQAGSWRWPSGYWG